MNQARRIPRLPAVTAAYIAGLIDGEGTITLTRLHACENRRLVVSIANTDLRLLEFVKSKVNAGKITGKKTSSDRHTPSFCYAISSRQALSLLQCVAPYLITYKRDRAYLALLKYRELTPRNGKYSDSLRAKRMEFEQEFLRHVSGQPVHD